MANGRLPESALARIPGGKLSNEAARSWNDMRTYIGRRHGVWIKPLGPNSSYRSYAGQQYYWNLWLSGRGNRAAYPGTSNHGWGNAVDVATPQMAYYIRKYGRRFGWSSAEGDRAGEWWHKTYVGGYKRKPDPLAPLDDRETRLVKELSALRRRASRRGKWYSSEMRRANAIKAWILERRANLRKAINKYGPNKANRKRRHDILGAVYRGKIY